MVRFWQKWEGDARNGAGDTGGLRNPASPKLLADDRHLRRLVKMIEDRLEETRGDAQDPTGQRRIRLN